MSSKIAVWLAFVLNFSFAIIEFIFGGLFGSSAILADAVHDLGDALAIVISAFPSISNREEDSHYTLGYKRFSLLGAHPGSSHPHDSAPVLVYSREYHASSFSHSRSIDQAILWLGVIADQPSI
ncbi:MAG: cation transporter [Streptococcus sp.]